MPATGFHNTPTSHHRRLLTAAAIATVFATLGLAAWHLLAPRGNALSAGRTVVAIDTTVQLDREERVNLIGRRVEEAFARDGRDVAVYAFGADAGEATEVLPFTRRSACKGPTCDTLWTGDARTIVERAATTTVSDATGSGILEATCSLPTRPGDTLLLVSDLTQRTRSLDVTSGSFAPDKVDGAVAAARRAGLVCPQLRGVHLVVLGFGSDGRSGPQAAALEAFWNRIADEAGAATVSIQRFDR